MREIKTITINGTDKYTVKKISLNQFLDSAVNGICFGDDYYHILPDRWRAEYCGEYWFAKTSPGAGPYPSKTAEYGWRVDDTRHQKGNYFKTREECLVAIRGAFSTGGRL